MHEGCAVMLACLQALVGETSSDGRYRINNVKWPALDAAEIIRCNDAAHEHERHHPFLCRERLRAFEKQRKRSVAGRINRALMAQAATQILPKRVGPI